MTFNSESRLYLRIPGTQFESRFSRRAAEQSACESTFDLVLFLSNIAEVFPHAHLHSIWPGSRAPNLSVKSGGGLAT